MAVWAMLRQKRSQSTSWSSWSSSWFSSSLSSLPSALVDRIATARNVLNGTLGQSGPSAGFSAIC